MIELMIKNIILLFVIIVLLKKKNLKIMILHVKKRKINVIKNICLKK